MGRGIALCAVRAGLDTVLVDIAPEVLDSATRFVRERLDREQRDADAPAPGRWATSGDLEASVGDADVVVEAVPEVASVKAETFARLAGAPAAALRVTNTSTMSVSELAGHTARPDRVVGMHFFNPAHRMPLVEVIVGDATADATRDEAVALAVRLGKEPVVVQDRPGFITSRLGLLLGTEAMRMVEEGVASAADIDTAMRLGYGHPMGPLQLADLVGLDARLNNLRSMRQRSGDPRYEPPELLVSLVAAGHLGRKSGRGFFGYDPDSSAEAAR
jgi:3-hydroxybutyryl-CoA dehydrogenase